jgi:hypothetical protein
VADAASPASLGLPRHRAGWPPLRCAYQQSGGLGGTPRANPATVAAGTVPRVRTAALRGEGARRTPSSPWLPGPRTMTDCLAETAVV